MNVIVEILNIGSAKNIPACSLIKNRDLSMDILYIRIHVFNLLGERMTFYETNYVDQAWNFLALQSSAMMPYGCCKSGTSFF